jgi:glycosyltransferase involved in cell wall biosynthesis
VVRARHQAARGYLTASLRGIVASRLPPGAVGWRHVYPHFVQIARAMGPVGDAFAPDLVHVHDFAVLPAGARIVAHARTRGRRASLLYDAHEYVRGMTQLAPGRLRAAVQLEAEHIRLADHILTVSPVTAELLEAEHGLARRPDVLLNAPLLAARETIPGVRATLGLEAQTPLLVYPGVVKPERGLAAVIEALPALAGVHLALITPTGRQHLEDLRARAEALGCGDRLHVLPYVPTQLISSFIADASVGIHPILSFGNANATLPNKLFEYLHARLPVVVSDIRASREVAAGLGIGEVFRPGDAADFARAVRTVLDDCATYLRALDEPGLAERYSWEAQGAILVDVYRPMLEGLGPIEAPSGERIAAILDGVSR